MLRRISTKLILAVLAAVVLPFVAFAFFINYQMGDRLTRDVVRQSLSGLAQDLAGQIDRFVEERLRDATQWAEDPLHNFALDNYDAIKGFQRTAPERHPPWDGDALARWAATREVPSPTAAQDWNFLMHSTRRLDSIVELAGAYDVLLLVSRDGRLATCNSRLSDGALLPAAYLRSLFEHDYAEEEWFQRAVGGDPTQLDFHVSDFRPFVDDERPQRNFHIGFSVPVLNDDDSGEVIGVFFTLVNWSHIQELVSTPVVKEYFRGLVDEETDPSPYAWIWSGDADTIIGHPDPGLYLKSVTRDVGLGHLVEAVRADEDGWGLYPEYEFRDEWKNAAFRRTAPPRRGGFYWVVGLGIDNDDIYATSAEMRSLLLSGTAIVLLLAVLLTMVIARRTTDPIQKLQSHTRRVAEGHLDETIEIRTGDELGELARDFNQMTRELKDQRDMLVRAEKDAAWREMAKQIAHDIKNPLTPIQLSLDLVDRARREGNPGYDDILERTLDIVGRQVKNLREIASTFYEFTGGRRPEPQVIELGELIDEVLRLHDAWAVEQSVDVRREGIGGRVHADPGKLRRVLGNLVSNALQAMPEGGALRVEVSPISGERVRVLVQDTGVGIPEEARAHLFEPYFTTRSEGTGLGLAIARRVIEEMGGSIELRSPGAGGVQDEAGTVAEVILPLHAGEATA
ncbi:MAG: sensor histidine kinase [Planctomycetota bacterium]